MIDVVFLLLIFFLITADFAKPENKLPAALQTEGGGVRSSDRVSLEQILSQLPRDAGVAIKAEPDVPIQAVATALQAARNAGFTRRSYVPSEPSE